MIASAEQRAKCVLQYGKFEWNSTASFAASKVRPIPVCKFFLIRGASSRTYVVTYGQYSSDDDLKGKLAGNTERQV